LIRREIGELRRIAQRPANRTGKVLILLYHRIAKLRSDPWSLAVTPRRFAEHLEVVRQYAQPIHLRQLSRALHEGYLPDRSVVITFDDGYADNLYNAKPLLKHYGIPATVFVPSGLVGSEREFWWDELDRLLLQPGTLPEKLHLSIKGNRYKWELGDGVRYDEETAWSYRYWRAWKKAPTSRHVLYNSLWKLMHTMTEAEQQEVLNELRRWADAESTGRQSHRLLSLDEVVALAQGGLVEIGAHTVTHPALSGLPPASQRDEILGSKAQLERLLGGTVTSFAYPYGKKTDYTAETLEIVRETGFICSCSNIPGVVELRADPFQLPRVHVKNWRRQGIAKQMLRWFGD
jgi:peptidoglycan/xylan/chitin deacetylase (PgdA/CDA1 family)